MKDHAGQEESEMPSAAAARQGFATAMVLAAGLGTRMAPASGCAAQAVGCASTAVALIDHVLDRVAAAGIGRAVVNVHHKADLIEQHVKAPHRAGHRQVSD